MISELRKSKFNGSNFLSELKFGVWGHTGSKSLRFTNHTDKSDSTANHFNYGAYLIADKLLFAEKSDSTQGLFCFVDLGYAPGDYNIFNYYAGGGLSYVGLFPKRDQDIFSLGIATPFFSKGIVKVDRYSSTEKAVELNNNFVTKYVNFQPGVQYLGNIAGNNTNEKFVFMIRIASHKGSFY